MFHIKQFNFMQVIVHTENDAYKVINSLKDKQLQQLTLICFVCYVAYSVYLDMCKRCIIITSYPFYIKVNHSLRSCFREAVFSIYHENFL